MVSSGAIIPARAPASIDMLHTVIRPSIERLRMAEPRYSMMWPVPPPVPIWPMMARTRSLAVTPAGQLAVDGHRHGGRPLLGEGLGGQDVLDLAGADAEGQGAEGPVGRGVAVAAHDGHARLGQALLGADDVDDALVGVAHRVAGDAELGAVGRQHGQLLGRDGIGHRLVDVDGGHVVVGGGDGQVGPVDAAAGHAQAVEGLGRGDLVDQVEVDEDDVGLVLVAQVDHVAVPHLFGQGAGRSVERAGRCGASVGWWHRSQVPTLTISTLRVPPGAAYSTASPAACPRRAWPSGEPGETTVRSPWRSSMDPTKKSVVSSSSSPS